MHGALFSKEFKCERLTLYELLIALQTIAEDHANQMGLGYESMIQTQTFWVLSRQKLILHAPFFSIKNFSVTTWSRPLKGMSATRDFVVNLGQTQMAESSSRWMVLDAITRRPTKPVFDLNKAITRESGFVKFDAEKVEQANEAVDLIEYTVQPSDLDQNNHVNNTKYTKWILEALPQDLARRSIYEYEINFINETHLYDVVHIQHQILDENKILIQGLRDSDQKILFTSKITWHPKNKDQALVK